MNTLKLFSVILLLVFLLQSCGKDEAVVDNLDLNSLQTTDQIDNVIAERLEAYTLRHPNPTVEIVSLDELNKTLLESGIEPLTKAEFSDEEWELLHNPNKASVRSGCNVPLSIALGDWNDDGVLSAADANLAFWHVHGRENTYGTLNDKIATPWYNNQSAIWFSLFTYHWNGGGNDSPNNGVGTISSHSGGSSANYSDRHIALRFILGLYC